MSSALPQLPSLSPGLVKALFNAPIEPGKASQSVQKAFRHVVKSSGLPPLPRRDRGVFAGLFYVSKHRKASLCQTEVAAVDPPLAKAGSASTHAGVQGSLSLPGRASHLYRQAKAWGYAPGRFAKPNPPTRAPYQACQARAEEFTAAGRCLTQQVPNWGRSATSASHSTVQPAAEAMPGTSNPEMLRRGFFGARDGAWLNTPQQPQHQVLRSIGIAPL